ncbi:MAG: hypothetical protein DCE90_13510 [Pseudanabaena sp.]|nr:MAG: hypothetical protein DCE90_13510 [Pseudanabaena sp.]
MLIDYDLVVLGMGSYAHQLVLAATKLEARVAWVYDQDLRDADLNISQIRQVFSILRNNLQKSPKQKRREVFYREIIPILNQFGNDLDIGGAERRLYLSHYPFAQREILENVQIDRVDVILGEWQFSELSQTKAQDSPLLEVISLDKNNHAHSRKLKSRAYAIANDDLPKRTEYPLGYLTINQLLRLEELPESVTLIGDDAYTCEVAQAVNFLGIKTTLIANHNHILPNVDVAIARTLQAQLEIEGIKIYTQAKVTAIEPLPNGGSKIWLDNQILECDRLLLASNSPNNSSSQFPKHSRIYACNSDLDVHKIINKTLQTSFWNSAKVVQNHITYVATTPPIAQLGKMQSLNSNAVHTLESANELGLCKVICDRQGHVLGASILGDHSKLVIEALNIAMQGKVKVQDLGIADLPAQWQAIKQPRGDRFKLRDWFTFRRDWNI